MHFFLTGSVSYSWNKLLTVSMLQCKMTLGADAIEFKQAQDGVIRQFTLDQADVREIIQPMVGSANDYEGWRVLMDGLRETDTGNSGRSAGYGMNCCECLTDRGNACGCCDFSRASANHSSNCSKCRDVGGEDGDNSSCTTPNCSSCSASQDHVNKHQTDKLRHQVMQDINANISKNDLRKRQRKRMKKTRQRDSKKQNETAKDKGIRLKEQSESKRKRREQESKERRAKRIQKTKKQ